MTNVHWDARQPASASLFRRHVCDYAATSPTGLPRGRSCRASCGSYSYPCVPAERLSGATRTDAACQRSPSSPCGSLRSLTGVHAGLFWGRHQLAYRPGAARGRDPASLGAPRLSASSMSSALSQQVFQHDIIQHRICQ